MMRLRNNIFLVSLVIAEMIMGPLPAYAATTSGGDISAVQGLGVLYNVDVFRIDSAGNVSFSSATTNAHTAISNTGAITLQAGQNLTLNGPSDIVFGSTGTAVSTATTSGASQGTIFSGYLDVGVSTVIAVTEGMAVCASTVVKSNSITLMACPQVLGYAPFVGIAAAAASTGSVVNVFNTGWVLALTTGTVLAGDLVVTSTQSQGYLEKWASTIAASSNTVVGVALAVGNTSGGLTRIRMR